ncbi:SHOCT domain-containing protein [Niveibacterium sp. SC-1]|uniref:SHOCT domain-containing protein n=1 Tax=Niveibacterium sp. SC-1 TaxID=3135646 RepID=UPI00311D909F
MYPQFTLRRLSLALALSASLACTNAQAGFFDNSFFGPEESARLTEWSKNPANAMRWGDWDMLRLEASQQGAAPSAQPVQLTPDQVAAAMRNIQIATFKEVNKLFSEAEVRRFAPAIAIGLSRATANQELVFITTGEHMWSGLIAPSVANAGRVFFADGRLNFLLGQTHMDYLGDANHGTRKPPKFDYGSRKSAAKGVEILGVTEGEAKLVRTDWIAVAVPTAAAASAAQQAVGQGTVNPAPAAVVPAPAANAPAVTAPSPAADATTDQFYRKQESRLRSLKRMRDEGLITDAEFQQKRAEIFKDL